MDLEGVGRMALVADPQGVPFYVMRGASDEASKSFNPIVPGHCSWNELSTPDQAGGLAFYTDQFGWAKGEAVPMGEMGDYQFILQDGEMIGAVMTNPPCGSKPSWKFAFAVADIDVAAEKIKAGGGTVDHGPAQVPGDSWVVVARDPQAAPFMVAGPRL
jgi:predicted enzyme related to lactoylglutathione lyase